MIEASLKFFKEYGWAGLIAVQYVATFWFLVRLLVKDRQVLVDTLEKGRDRTERIAKILQATVDTERACADALLQLQKSVNEDIQLQREFIAYLKARDQFKKGEE